MRKVGLTGCTLPPGSLTTLDAELRAQQHLKKGQDVLAPQQLPGIWMKSSNLPAGGKTLRRFVRL
jgi:hypothetical protein